VKVVADTGPLVAATNARDKAHKLSASLVSELGRQLIIPDVVLVEVDQLLRARASKNAALAFLKAISAREHEVAFLSQGLLVRAAEIDGRFSDLDLGLVDASVMAYAERHELPILTFDFDDFRAAPPASGYWRLVVDETRYAEATG
jgi:uncharacterized protein